MNEFRAAVRAFTTEGVLIGLDPLRLSIAGSQNDDDGADVVVQILNQLSVINPDSGLEVVSHTTKAGATSAANGYAEASYATSGSALYSQHARSNFLLARLTSDEIRKMFDLPADVCARQTVARLKHGRLSHDVESAELYVLMDGGLLRPIVPEDVAASASGMIDAALPLVAQAIARLDAKHILSSETAIIMDSDLIPVIGKGHAARKIVQFLTDNGYIEFKGTTSNRHAVLTDKGRGKVADIGTSRNESRGRRG